MGLFSITAIKNKVTDPFTTHPIESVRFIENKSRIEALIVALKARKNAIETMETQWRTLIKDMQVVSENMYTLMPESTDQELVNQIKAAEMAGASALKAYEAAIEKSQSYWQISSKYNAYLSQLKNLEKEYESAQRTKEKYEKAKRDLEYYDRKKKKDMMEKQQVEVASAKKVHEDTVESLIQRQQTLYDQREQFLQASFVALPLCNSKIRQLIHQTFAETLEYVGSNKADVLAMVETGGPQEQDWEPISGMPTGGETTSGAISSSAAAPPASAPPPAEDPADMTFPEVPTDEPGAPPSNDTAWVTQSKVEDDTAHKSVSMM